jgi:tetratricopeptide (TPR) repeat protein
MPKKRVFLSAVSDEFRPAREALAGRLRAAGLEVADQATLAQRGPAASLLDMLRLYIKECDAVVCLVGGRYGGFPPEADAARHRDGLPADVAAASYTQWEYYLAAAERRHVYTYFATSGFIAAPGDAAQTAFIERLIAANVHRTPVESAEQWIIETLVSLVRDGTAPDSVLHQPIDLPYQSIGGRFKGRDQFLRDLRDSLLEHTGATAIVSNALLGMGGIGKTRAAVEYAWAYRENYSALLFAQADSPANLRTYIAKLSGPLLLPDLAGLDEEARYHAVLAWLRAHPVWLLILDNVDTDPAREAALEMLGSLTDGHVVLTSRQEAGKWDGVTPLDLDVLPVADAAAFLLEATASLRPRHEDDAARAAELAGELGQLPLALELAAATIRQRKCSFADYLAIWRESRDLVKGWNQRTVTGYHSAVGQTWATSVAEVSRAARILLQRLAFLAPDPVPGFALDLPVPHGPEVKAPREALLELAAYSLVKREAESGQFTVHRLIQDATRRGLDAVEAEDRLTEALWWMNAAFEDAAEDPHRWPRLTPLIPHAEAVAFAAEQVGIADPTVRLMLAVGSLLRAQVLYARAEPLLRHALTIAERNPRPTHPLLANALSDLARLLHETNRLAEAESLFRRALAIAGARFGPNHPVVAATLNNLAGLLQDTNRLGEAEPLMRRALGIDEASYGKDHPSVARDLNNLAGLLQDTNRLGEAEPLIRRALGIGEASYGKDHPDVARDLNNLALLLQATNRLGEAEPLMRRMVVIFLRFQRDTGHSHPNGEACLRNYATLLSEMGFDEPAIRARIDEIRREAGPG